MGELLSLFVHIVVISLTTFTGSAQAVFYDVGVLQEGWITSDDYTNYLGFGFATPGPAVFSLATFMGYSVAGLPGAIVGTIAIYLPPIILALLTGRYLKKWMLHDRMGYFIKSVGLAAAGVLVFIGLSIISKTASAPYIIIAAVASVAAAKRISPLLIIVAGFLVGLILA